MSGQTRGREVGQPTLAIRAMFEKHGALTYKEALPHIEKMSDEVRAYYTESTDGKNQGSNRYNVAKASWNKSKGHKVKSTKTAKVAKVAKVEKKVVSRKPRTVAPTFNTSAMAEVASMGGLQAVRDQIAKLQELVSQTEASLSKVA